VTEQEAAERLCALLNEIHGAGHEVELSDFEVYVGSGLLVGTTFTSTGDEFVVRDQ